MKRVCIIGNDYRYDRLDVPVALQEKTSKGIRIGRDVWLGAGCVVTRRASAIRPRSSSATCAWSGPTN